MDRQRIMIVVLIAAIGLGGIASYSIYKYLQSQQQEVAKAKADMAPVVVAADNIPFGTRVEARQLKKVLWPRTNIPQGTFTETTPLVGRTVVSGIVAGEPLLEAKLAPTEANAGIMAYIIPEGERAMAVAVNEVVGVGGFVLPNSSVDVVVTTTPPGGEKISKIVIENLKVLAVGQKMEEKEGKAVIVPTVTVSLTPENAEKLALASNAGPLQLLLRSSKDTGPVSTKGVTLPNLLKGKSESLVVAQATATTGKRVRKAAAPKQVEKAMVVKASDAVTIDLIKANRTEIKRSQDVLEKDEENGIWKKEAGK